MKAELHVDTMKAGRDSILYFMRDLEALTFVVRPGELARPEDGVRDVRLPRT